MRKKQQTWNGEITKVSYRAEYKESELPYCKRIMIN